MTLNTLSLLQRIYAEKRRKKTFIITGPKFAEEEILGALKSRELYNTKYLLKLLKIILITVAD